MNTKMSTASAATDRDNDQTAPMQLAIRQMPSPNRLDGYTHLIQWQGTPAEARTVAEAWATVRGHDRVLRILADVFDSPPTGGRWRITLHKPAALMLIFRWPWSRTLPSLDVWP